MEDPQTLIASVESLPYLGIFILFLLANAAIPIPEEIFIVILGYVGGAGLTNLWIAIPLAIIGFFISDIILFSLAKSGNKYITRLREKMLRGVLEKDLSVLRSHTKKIIFFSRFLVGFRFLGPAIAGTLRVPMKTFVLYNFLALIIYVPFLVSIGYYFQDKISAIINDVGAVRHYLFLISATVLFFLFSGTIRKTFFKMFSMLTKNGQKPDVSILRQQEQEDGWMFVVAVSGKERTEHTVYLSSEYYTTRTQENIAPAEVIERAFTFLLDRESNTEILREFSVRDIESFFPSFKQRIEQI